MYSVLCKEEMILWGSKSEPLQERRLLTCISKEPRLFLSPPQVRLPLQCSNTTKDLYINIGGYTKGPELINKSSNLPEKSVPYFM